MPAWQSILLGVGVGMQRVKSLPETLPGRQQRMTPDFNLDRPLLW